MPGSSVQTSSKETGKKEVKKQSFFSDKTLSYNAIKCVKVWYEVFMLPLESVLSSSRGSWSASTRAGSNVNALQLQAECHVLVLCTIATAIHIDGYLGGNGWSCDTMPLGTASVIARTATVTVGIVAFAENLSVW